MDMDGFKRAIQEYQAAEMAALKAQRANPADYRIPNRRDSITDPPTYEEMSKNEQHMHRRMTIEEVNQRMWKGMKRKPKLPFKMKHPWLTKVFSIQLFQLKFLVPLLIIFGALTGVCIWLGLKLSSQATSMVSTTQSPRNVSTLFKTLASGDAATSAAAQTAALSICTCSNSNRSYLF